MRQSRARSRRRREHDRAHLNCERRRHALDCAQLSAVRQGGIAKDCHSRHAGGDFLEQFQPFCANAVFVKSKAGDVAAWTARARDEALANRVGDRSQTQSGRCGLPAATPPRSGLSRPGSPPARERSIPPRTAESASSAPQWKSIASSGHRSIQIPASLAEIPSKRDCPSGSFAGPRSLTRQCAARAQLLRARHDRPRRRAAEPRDERAPFHSITSSARASSDGGMSRPSAFAVLRLITNSTWSSPAPASRLASRL